MDSYLANPALNVTLFAPMNSAFTSLSEEVHSQWINEENSPYCIQYHILNGTWSYEALKDREGPVTSLLGGADLMITLENDEVVVDGASILVQDIPATNGIIHMIDVVLIPPPIIDPGISYMSLLRLLELTSHFSKFKESLLILLPPTSKLWFSYPTLREILEKEPQCSSFNEYMVEYHLLNQLEFQQEYTVFVPTDSAFEALAMKQTGPVGIDLIKYHIFAGAKILSSELHDGFHHPTWLGHNYQLTFSHHDNQIWINSQAYIVERDMKTDKGVVHVIHAVLDVLANRCDINETATMMSECISCTLPPVCLDGYQPIIPLNGMHSNCQYTRQLRGRQYATDGCYVTCQMTTYTQICCQGFYGTSCRACPGGSVDPCNGHGTCHDGMGGDGICKCDEQFTGTACEMCAPGFYGNMCSQECPCVNGQCITSPVFDTVQCLCQGGWVGQYCNQ
ncbi:stabilin-2-like, partial [Saccoglossus kowalevskii]